MKVEPFYIIRLPDVNFVEGGTKHESILQADGLSSEIILREIVALNFTWYVIA